MFSYVIYKVVYFSIKGLDARDGEERPKAEPKRTPVDNMKTFLFKLNESWYLNWKNCFIK